MKIGKKIRNASYYLVVLLLTSYNNKDLRNLLIRLLKYKIMFIL